MRHSLTRTSPKGGPFIGKCLACGKENVSIDDSSECPNTSGMTQDERLMRAIEGDKTK